MKLEWKRSEVELIGFLCGKPCHKDSFGRLVEPTLFFRKFLSLLCFYFSRFFV